MNPPSGPRDTPGATRSLPWRDVAAAVLLVVGSLQMLGDATGILALKAIGAALVASPLPKVFSDVRGLETFASEFTLLATLPAGGEFAEREFTESITPEVYRRVGGPYNRRNVYGAALSYAPRLPPPLWQAVFCYGLRSGGPLRRELGLPAGARHVCVRIETRTRGRAGVWVLEAPCAE